MKHTKYLLCGVISFAFALFYAFPAYAAIDDEAKACIECHRKVNPGIVGDWEKSKHSEEEITCLYCHGDSHKNSGDPKKATLPDEHLCSDCHQEQFDQFVKGKHNFGWTSLNAIPVTHIEPDEFIEGGKGCGGCHNMGIKNDAQKEDQKKKGYRYQNNSCDECHTRHLFSKEEAKEPKACKQCHMGYDHPQYEMWESSKHGTRYESKKSGVIDKEASVPTCQFCHMPEGTHTNRTAWGFLGVRLPLPEDKQWAADRTTILKALGVLNPFTGEPTDRLNDVKAVDMARLTQDDWENEREKIITRCTHCHSENYARKQLESGDKIMQKADRLMAEGIEIVAGLYKDGIIKKSNHYPFAYPDFLFCKQTGGSYIDQVLFRMFMKHRMRTYQGVFHSNPDYAYWYGWAAMTKSLGEIKELDKSMRSRSRK